MDRDKLARLRKQSAENKLKKHQELLDSNTSIKEAVLALSEAINGQQPYDDSKLVAQLQELKQSQTFSEDIKRLEVALKQSSDKEKLDELIKTVSNINNQDVVSAVNNLMVKLEENTPDQSADEYRPFRRVIKVGNRFVFDDKPTPVALGGGGSSINTSTLAKFAKQDEQTAVLEQIRGFDIPVYTKIIATYPTDTTELYTYLNGATEVAGITVTYTDDTKASLSEVELNAV